MRIASLAPGATDVVVALGHGSELVARTHECDHPRARHAPVVTAPAPPDDLSPAAIDAVVAAREAHAVSSVDTARVRSLEPDVVILQTTCAARAPDAAAVFDALSPAAVVAFGGNDLDDVIDGVSALGDAIGDRREGLALASHMRRRLAWLAATHAAGDRPRVALVAWPDPPSAPGRWVPDLVAAAGGESVLGAPGEKAERITVEQLAAAAADVIVLGFCGMDLAATTATYDEQLAGVWPAASRVLALDGSRLVGRPGPRLVDGAEALAWALHGAHRDLRPPRGCVAELRHSGWEDLGG